MQSKLFSPCTQHKLLKNFLQTETYVLLQNLAQGMDFAPNETLKGSELREDIYFKACQREGVQKLFRLLECRLYLLETEIQAADSIDESI